MSATGSTTGEGTTSGSTGTTTGEEPFHCEGSVPILLTGTDLPTGFERCDNGLVHRVEPVVCVDPRGSGACTSGVGSCRTDADCVDRPYGTCNDDWDQFGECTCNYGCESDADCGVDEICVCAGVVPRAMCIPARCPDDASCADEWCALSRYEDVCFTTSRQVACTGTGDCRIDHDCGVREHARMCFEIAARFGPVVEPGPLPVKGALQGSTDVRAILRGLVRDACMAETLAAIEAAEAAAWTKDPAIARALERIAADESRHAQLGWASLRWILEQSPDEIRRYAFELLEDGMASIRAESPVHPIAREARLRGYGTARLDARLRAETRARALREVVEPCAAALRARLEGHVATGPAAAQRGPQS